MTEYDGTRRRPACSGRWWIGCATSARGPKALFDRAVAWLVERKVLLPGGPGGDQVLDAHPLRDRSQHDIVGWVSAPRISRRIRVRESNFVRSRPSHRAS
jgi:hypothetical protein